MKATRLLFVLAITSLVSAAYASDRTAAYNLICKPMTFESDRANCLNQIKRFTYFDKRALTFCSGLNFDSNKMNCLQIIGDRVYEGYEMDHCLSLTFDSQKLECMQNSGTIYNPNRPACVPREETISQLSSSLREMRTGNVRAADQRISALLERFTDCI